MQFFNKYKDLFDIRQHAPLPRAKLALNNELFIQKPYIATYTQEYILNSKLKELKKDYNDLEKEVNYIQTIKKTPKRVISSHKKAIQDNPYPQKRKLHTQNRQMFNLIGSKVLPNDSNRWLKQKKMMLNDHLKRQSWLRDEQINIIKHAELQHIFVNKLPKSNIYQSDEIKERTLPKLDKSDSVGMDNSFKAKQRVPQNQNKGNSPFRAQKQQIKQKNTLQNAGSRRQKAINTLQFRRKKLQQLLRSLW